MAISQSRDRNHEFAAFSGGGVRDLDPESDASFDEEDDDISSQSDIESTDGREHYVDIDKSKLRKPKEARLGPQYRGLKISRDAFEDAEDDGNDPFSKGFESTDEEDEIGEDEMEDDSDQELEQDSTDEGADTQDTEMSDQDGAVDFPTVDKAELRKAMATEQATVAATLSAASKVDAEKGKAVIQQRATFDALLNARIKLQKSLIATNSLVALSSDELNTLASEHASAVQDAEAAASRLWNTLTNFREQLTTGHKRRRTGTNTAEINTMLAEVKTQEETSTHQRNAVLQKWSLKSRGVSTTSQQNRLNNEQPATIIDVLNEHLSSSERLLKRARTPRSCAPVQLANRVVEDDKIYDDADFYGLLLKELLDAKSSAASAAATNVDLTNFNKMRRDAKTRRVVDTKASKGRKLKYNVHGQLQNYCAPEDKTTWGERQIEDLFSSLFGQQNGLNEDTIPDADVESDDERVDLPLFAS